LVGRAGEGAEDGEEIVPAGRARVDDALCKFQVFAQSINLLFFAADCRIIPSGAAKLNELLLYARRWLSGWSVV
jgi:hypothetical protein